MLSLAPTGISAVPRANTRSSRVFSLPRVYLNPVMWIALLSFLAVTKSWAGSLPDFSTLVKEEGDAVVKISVATESAMPASSGIPGFDPERVPEQFRRFFEPSPQNRNPQPRRGEGFGSGFIIAEDGYVITNAHVVKDAVDIRVGLQDRRELKAELVGIDVSTDIALLKVDATELPIVTMGDSDELQVGEWVLAIGSPFGFEYTATQGIVSALARTLPDDTYVPFIQTDVAVNPGNSGGPLFNTDGDVVGVNSQIYSRSGGYQGLSFAIPINVAVQVAEQLKDQGYATRGWLGVKIQPINQALAESFGLAKPEGALVAEVTQASPADKGGLGSGDIILSFNGKSVKSFSALPPLVGTVRPGSTVEVEVLRDGKRKKLRVTIETLEADEQVSKAAAEAEADDNSSRIGAVLANVAAADLDSMGLDNGVLVSKLDPSGAAADAGVQPGDVIVSFNRKAVESVDELEALLQDVPAGEAIPVLVQRQEQPIFLALTLPENG